MTPGKFGANELSEKTYLFLVQMGTLMTPSFIRPTQPLPSNIIPLMNDNYIIKLHINQLMYFLKVQY